MLRVVGARLRRLVGIIEELSFTTVRHRLAAMLVRLAKSDGQRQGDTVTITLPANNNELAAQIGTVRELVSRNLSRLQSEGLIRIEGRIVTVPGSKKAGSGAGHRAVRKVLCMKPIARIVLAIMIGLTATASAQQSATGDASMTLTSSAFGCGRSDSAAVYL